MSVNFKNWMKFSTKAMMLLAVIGMVSSTGLAQNYNQSRTYNAGNFSAAPSHAPGMGPRFNVHLGAFNFDAFNLGAGYSMPFAKNLNLEADAILAFGSGATMVSVMPGISYHTRVAHPKLDLEAGARLEMAMAFGGGFGFDLGITPVLAARYDFTPKISGGLAIHIPIYFGLEFIEGAYYRLLASVSFAI